MASEEDNQHNDAVPINLPAPAGWSKKASDVLSYFLFSFGVSPLLLLAAYPFCEFKGSFLLPTRWSSAVSDVLKKFTPKKSSTPQRKDIVFISPTGEEIKSKRQLDQYLKSHPGGPAASEFDWSTGDTPRRSTRLSEKPKADVTPSSPSPRKRQKKSITKGSNEKSNADAEEEATGEKDAAAVEAKETVEGSTVDAKDTVDEDVIAGKPLECEDEEKITGTQVASEEPSAAAPVGTETKKSNANVGESNNDAKNDEIKEPTSAGNETADGKVGNSGTASDNLDCRVEKAAEGKGNYPQQ